MDKAYYLVLISSVAAMGGLLFGFDTAVISGTIALFRAEFGLSQAMVGWVASSAIVGCFFGALIAGFLSDQYGRKRVLMLSAAAFFISAVWALNLHSAESLVLARLVGGLGIGMASVVSPVYISEISPALLRGRLMALQQFAIVLGILAAYFSNSCIIGARLTDPSKWRWMFGVGAIPSVLFFCFLLAVPESPRWLLGKGREQSSLNDLFKPGIRRALFVGVLLAFFTQITGINAIMYYAPEIFTNAGVGVSSAFSYTVWIGLVNIIFTLIAMFAVDRLGRKPLLLSGILCMALALFYVGAALYTRTSGIGLLLGVLVYVASFAMSLGVVSWVIFSEIFPTALRGRAVAIVTGVVWAACFLVSLTFPVLMKNAGGAAVFWIYGTLSLLAFVFVLKGVPETKGKSLEEIEKSWE